MKRVGTFAPALNDKRFGNGGIEKREKGIKKSFFRKALESKKDDYLCTPQTSKGLTRGFEKSLKKK